MESAGKRDLYEVLGVARDADAEQIRKAYRKLARRHHPDVNPGDAAAEEEFKAVSEAHAVLADEDRRRDYGETRRVILCPVHGRLLHLTSTLRGPVRRPSSFISSANSGCEATKRT